MEDCVNNYSTYETNPILYNSYCFHTRIQYPEETFIDFLNDVIELAKYCDFEAKNRMIRDQIVVGMRNSNLRNELFKLGNPKLDDLIEYLKTVDLHSENQTESLDGENKSLNCEDIYEKGLNEQGENEEETEFEGDSGDSHVNEEENNSVSYNLHSYIIKKEIAQNENDETELGELDKGETKIWNLAHTDQNSAASSERDSPSDDSTTSNQCVPRGYSKEHDSNSVGDNSSGALELDKKDTKTEEKLKNERKIENKSVKVELKGVIRSKPKQPEYKNYKVVEVIELSDSDEEGFKNHFNSNVTEKLTKVVDNNNSPKLNVPDNNAPRFETECDIYSGSTRPLHSQTEVTLENNLNFEKNSKNKKNIESPGSSFSCAECHKEFSSKYILKGHVLRHFGDGPFKCDYCSKNFSYLQNLNTHILIHRNEKPYKCDECDKTFRQPANLDAHIIRHHKKLICNEENKTSRKRRRRFYRDSVKCIECGKSLSSDKALTRHKLIHLGLKPHECEYCGKKYTQRYNLKKHLFIVHSKEKS